jgi:GT2 family glycosyltransferase
MSLADVPPLSVVVVNWNGRRLLAECLRSLAAQSLAGIEIVLVDNASSDDSVALVRREFPEVEIVALDRNLGFAGGSNRGIAAARAPFVALLNNDAVAEPTWAAHLLEAARDPRVGLAASRVLLYDDRSRLDSAGDGMTTVGVAYKRGHLEPGARFSEPADVFGASGCAMLLRRAMLEDVGLFDERFFLIYEDADLAFRARLRGWKCRYAPEARAYHRVNASIGRLSATHVFYGQRNAERVYFKNMPAPLVWRHLGAHLANALLAALYFTAKGRFLSFARAKLAFLAGLPEVLAARRTIQARATVAPSEVAALLEPRWLRARRAGK